MRIDHVLPMSFAFLSTKREFGEATGKFGVGLQTLKTLGGRLEVHCPPYPFVVEGSQVRRIPGRRAIAGVYAPSKFDTLLALQLRSGADLEELRRLGQPLGRGLDAVPPSCATDRGDRSRQAEACARRARAPKGSPDTEATSRSEEVESNVTSAQLSERASKQRFTRFIADVPVPKASSRGRTRRRHVDSDGLRARWRAGPILRRLAVPPGAVAAVERPRPARPGAFAELAQAQRMERLGAEAACGPDLRA